MHNFLQRPELLSALLASMQDGLSISDTEGVLIYVNDAFCKMLGFAREELIETKPPYLFWPSDELATLDAAMQRTLHGDFGNFELKFQRKDGTRIEVIVAPAMLGDNEGTPLGYFATVKDISRRKQLERSLLESEQRWRSIAENPFDFVVLIDRNYRYTYINHTAPGISAEQLIGVASPFEFVDPQYHDRMRTAIDETFATGRATSYEVFSPPLDAWFSTIVGAVVKGGKISEVSMLTRDITPQKQAEETLQRSDHRLHEARRMEIVGTLAGGIAHDINNMLTPILASADLAKLELPVDHIVQPRLNAISNASQRARELIQRVLLFSRNQEPERTYFDWRLSVHEDLGLLRTSIPSGIALVTSLPDEPIPVFADRAQLGQVLTNLVTNALQAMRDLGGKLLVTLERDQGSSDQAILSVIDTGPGLDPDTLHRAFEPFFTTKPVGSGTGLGLSIVESVVREHGGNVTITSSPGKGATFAVRLPIVDPAAGHAVDDRSRVAMQSSTAPAVLRVLVVDDESAIVEVAQQALSRSGHAVKTAISAREALEMLTREPEAFDVVLTDQSMPSIKGTELIAQVRKLRPELPCILMTGLADEALQLQAKALGVSEILAKPFLLATLCDVVSRAGNSKKV